MEEKKYKSDFISKTQAIMLAILAMTSFVMLVIGNYFLAIAIIISAIIICITLNIFKVIIDLLQSIDEKLNNNKENGYGRRK